MSSDWTEVSLQEVTSKLGDGLHGTPNYDDNGEYFFINGNNLGSGRIVVDEKTKRVSATEYLKHKKDIGDRTILVSINGTIGNVALYYGEKVVLGKSACYFNVVDSVDKQYVRYVVTGEYFQNYIRTLATGSTIKNVSLKLMRDFRFQLPPIEIQRKISKTLEDLDNKIELNRQTNQTLEQIAQALFKSWFVDFEPTRAKIAAKEAGASPEEIERAAMCAISGKTPGQLAQLPPETQQNLKTTAALFSDALVDSELGEIPAGWEITQVTEIAKIIKGKSYKSSELQESKTALVTLKSFNRGGGYRLDGLKEFTGSYKSEQEVFAGDIVIAYTDVTQAADVIGKPAMIVSDLRYEHLVISLDVAVIRPHKDFYKYYIYGMAKSEEFQQHTAAHTTGTTVLHLSSKAVPEFRFARSSDRLIESFAKTVSAVFKLINERIEEARSLENLRDAILPKLLSGEIQINESLTDLQGAE